MNTVDQHSPILPHYARSLVELTLEFKVGESDLSSDPLFISGNIGELGNWKPDCVELLRIRKGTYRKTVKVPTGKLIEFKVTRGSWSSQAVYGPPPPEVPPNNLIVTANEPGKYCYSILSWMDKLPRQSDPVLGHIVKHADMTGCGLRYPRDVYVWLPPSYYSCSDRYQVVIMHDGQNLFDPQLAHAGIDWGVDETVVQLAENEGAREVIVVGISNTPDRMTEYNLFRKPGKSYAAFLQNILLPFIEENYRTLIGPKNTAVMGSSMGGLFAFQLAWTFPEVYSMAGCLSTAFWSTNNRIFGLVEKDCRGHLPLKFYLDTGEYEQPIVEGYDRMRDLLTKKGWREGHDLQSYFEPGANHSEHAWRNRLHRPFRFFFQQQIART